MIALPCDCKCCMLVVEKAVWNDGDVSYNISIQDSRYDHNYNTLWGRVKRAIKILLGKPIYYNDLHLRRRRDFLQFCKGYEWPGGMEASRSGRIMKAVSFL